MVGVLYGQAWSSDCAGPVTIEPFQRTTPIDLLAVASVGRTLAGGVEEAGGYGSSGRCIHGSRAAKDSIVLVTGSLVTRLFCAPGALSASFSFLRRLCSWTIINWNCSPASNKQQRRSQQPCALTEYTARGVPRPKDVFTRRRDFAALSRPTSTSLTCWPVPKVMIPVGMSGGESTRGMPAMGRRKRAEQVLDGDDANRRF